jgi:hypothetical protein
MEESVAVCHWRQTQKVILRVNPVKCHRVLKKVIEANRWV